MKFSEYIFDQNNRDTLTRDHLITAKTIKRAHRRRSEQVPSKGGDVTDRPIDYRSQYE